MGCPCLQKWPNLDLNLNSNSNLNLNQKRNKGKKRKRKGLGHLGQPRPLGPNSFSSAQASRAHSAGLQQRKRKTGRTTEQAHGHLTPRPSLSWPMAPALSTVQATSAPASELL